MLSSARHARALVTVFGLSWGGRKMSFLKDLADFWYGLLRKRYRAPFFQSDWVLMLILALRA
jgi:hypothetical protein